VNIIVMFVVRMVNKINVIVYMVRSVFLSLRGCVFEPWLE